MPLEIFTLSARELWLTSRGYSRYQDKLPFPDEGLRDWLDSTGYHARTRYLIDRAPALVAGVSVRPVKRKKKRRKTIRPGSSNRACIVTSG